MRASVVVPVYAADEEALRQLGLCLKGLAGGEFELLVVDDGSPRLGPEVARMVAAAGGRYLRMAMQSGPALARNLAAGEARGDVLLFFDADTVVHADTISRLLGRLEGDEGLAAVMGSYDVSPEDPGVVSQFRNLLHCFVHHESAGEAQTFWTGCGAVRRSWFARLGGFAARYREPSIEDVEFGCRLAAAGGRIWLDPAAQVTHLKRWTLVGMVKTDLWKRAVPWTRLMRTHGLPKGLNFSWKDRVAGACVGLMGLSLGLGYWVGFGWWIVPALLLVWLKWGLLRFLVGQRGVGFGFVCYWLLVLHLTTAVVGFVIGRIWDEHWST